MEFIFKKNSGGGFFWEVCQSKWAGRLKNTNKQEKARLKRYKYPVEVQIDINDIGIQGTERRAAYGGAPP